MKNHSLSPLASLLLPFVLAICNLQADTFTVTRTNNTGPGSLPVVISQANATAGDQTIEFAVTGTITLVSPLPTITNNLTINGRVDNPVVISGGGTVPIFAFAPGTTNILSRLSLANGYSSGGGAAINNAGTLFVNGCAITGHSSPGGSGGAISNAGSMTILSSILSGNQATTGGAIYSSGSAIIADSKLLNNQAAVGGALCNMGNCGVENSIVTNNSATQGLGGGIFNGGNLSASASTLVGNNALGGNGAPGTNGLIYSYMGNLSLVACGGGGGGGGGGLGGGVFMSQGTLLLTNCTISGNTAQGGRGGNGGIAVTNTGSSNPGLTAGGGGAGGGIGGGNGGAINTAGSGEGGGGVGGFAAGGGGGSGGRDDVVARTAVGGSGGFSGGSGGQSGSGSDVGANYRSAGGRGGNGGSGCGGALFAKSGSVSLVNCTITGNTASSGDGGAGSDWSPSGSTGQGIGGGVYSYGGTVNPLNTIIAANNAANSGTNLYGAFVSTGFNLIGSNQGATGLSINDFQNEPANLGPLQDNGGSTLTHALLQGSLAIGSGTSVGAPATDQRGIPRPLGHCDIGAFQLVTLITPTITWPTPADITYGTPLGSNQLNAAVGVDGTLTYTPPSGTVLSAGTNQVLTVVFAPANLAQYAAVTSSVTINVLKANQTISFTPLPNRQLGDPPVLLSANASSALPVTFNVVAGPATLTGNLLTLGSASGLVTVRASQSGNANFTAAPFVDRSFFLGVLPLPLLTAQPLSQAVHPGDRVSFSIGATNGPLTYQWRFAGMAMPGESSASLVLARVKATVAGPYDVIVSNPSGSVTSLVATLTVTIVAGSPIIVSQPQGQRMRVGESLALTVVASGATPSVLYQWYQGSSGDTNGLIPGATNASYTALSLTTNASFWVNLRNAFGLVDSDSAVVSVFPASAAKLRLQMFSGMPGLTIDGPVGTAYRIEYKTNFAAISWTRLIDISLPGNPFTFYDAGAVNTSTRFYRVVAP